ncbi:MAG TPA: tripartite tricarboxylate transporter permease [Candidatus Thermoplasmatota archaeon]|nr:tripartite tricarboxylate transporter permease [Candidatus Thermoplasmatota archaeon]
MADFGALSAAMSGTMLGCLLGLLAGLVPGLHANNLSQAIVGARPLFVASMAWLLAAGAGPGGGPALFAACGFLVGVALGHAFTDEIPAVFLGAPDPDTALSVLPGHRLLLAGLGGSAVRAAAVGTALGVLFSLPLVPLLAGLLGPPLNLYGAAERWIPALLLGAAFALVWSEGGRPEAGLSRGRARGLSLGLLMVSGALGELVVFSGVVLPDLRLFPVPGALAGGHMLSLFAGLFGLPTLLLAAAVPPSEPLGIPGEGELRLPRRRLVGSAALGMGAGAAVGWLPGVGAAQAAVLATGVRDGWRHRARGPRDSASVQEAAEFLVVQSAVASANLVFNLVALFSLLRVRSGTMAALGEVGGGAVERWEGPLAPPELLIGLLLGIVVALPICLAGALALGRACARVYLRLPPRRLAGAVFLGLVVLILALEGAGGLLVAAPAVLLGLVPPLAGVKRVHLMGAILLPVAVRLLLAP